MTDRVNDSESLPRIGGLAMVLALGIHVVLNAVVKTFPPDDPTLEELRGYLQQEAGNWAVVHGFRYLAFACVVVFGAALYSRCVAASGGRTSGWGVVGLLGISIWVTNGVVTNGVETLAVLVDLEGPTDETVFWLLFDLTRVLFTAEVAAWAMAIFGFSMAGSRGQAIPTWLCWLGIVAAAAALLSSVFVVNVLSGGWATSLIDAATIASLTWFLCVGILMIVSKGG